MPDLEKLQNEICAQLGVRDDDFRARSFVAQMLDNFVIFLKKHHDYGPGNISKKGEYGVLNRIEDKVERLSCLFHKIGAPNFESEFDSWRDIAVYGIIGQLTHQGKWGAIQCDVKKILRKALNSDAKIGQITKLLESKDRLPPDVLLAIRKVMEQTEG